MIIPIISYGKTINTNYNDGIWDVSEYKLKSLYELPEGIRVLYCFTNKLESLPELPEGILDIYCYKNNIEYLPKLPKSLEYLACHNNPLKCIIPFEHIHYQSYVWLEKYYYPYISSYDGQKNILTREPHMVSELMGQTVLLNKIKEEFGYLINGCELNLL